MCAEPSAPPRARARSTTCSITHRWTRIVSHTLADTASTKSLCRAVRQTFSGRVSQILDSWTSGKSGQVSGNGSHDIDKYNALHDDKKTSVEGRNAAYVDLVNSYYNLATDFYEWGWGQSFHFAERLQGEDFGMSIARHEYYLAMRLGIQPSDHVLDCGCGIGGPLRNIGRFTSAKVTGVTLNQYQVDRGNRLCQEAHLDDRCRLVQADFHKLPFAEATFNSCYSIEACCHSPDRVDVYSEVFRVLKPGGYFASYEWCLTEKHDPLDERHLWSKKKIEEGDGLPGLTLTTSCDAALKRAGFEIIESRDAALDPNPGGEPWYKILTASYNLASREGLFRLQFTYWGTFMMNIVLNFMEFVGIAPRGSGKVREMLRQAQLGLVAGGEMGTFTPMYVVIGRKPL